MDSSLSNILVWIPLFPLIGAVVNGAIALGTSHRERAVGRGIVGAIGCLAPALAFAVTIASFLHLRVLPVDGRVISQHLFPWFAAGRLRVDVGLLFDPLSAAMLLFVTGIGTLIHVYSLGYMAHERGVARYFSYLNLFTFAMVVLVLGDGLLPMFVGWEGVGLCSYLLIGFWFTDEEKAIAGNKAFIVNRIGDFGFLLGIFLIFWTLASYGRVGLTYHEIGAGAAAGLFPQGTLTAACLLLFMGACGKSAQLPLYVWLPDAMAGPTPVSALIHAATMVTSGIYMVSRLSFLFVSAPVALTVVAIVGAATAFFAATIGCAQNDIKKVLAYSTVSQLGYMFLGCGVGAFSAGMFHVVTHSFFKACLFLGAGSVIHALSGEQDIRKMGGLLRKIPTTGWTFLVAWLAIAGIAPFAGFFSKDEILWQAFSRPNEVLPWLPHVLWAVGFVTAGITALYMTRLIGLVFLGPSRVSGEAAHHVHESPATMTAPLVILAAGSLLIGFLGVPEFIAHGGDRFGAWLSPSIASAEIAHEAGGAGLEWGLMIASLGIAIAGIAGGLFLYVRAPELPGRIAARCAPIYRMLVNKYWVDEIYEAAVVRPIREGSRMVLWKGVDVRLIDGVVNGVGFMSRMGSSLVRIAQTGAVQLYAAAVLIGVVFLLWVMR